MFGPFDPWWLFVALSSFMYSCVMSNPLPSPQGLCRPYVTSSPPLTRRDRAAPLWQSVRNHIYSVVMSASASHHNQLMERGIVGLIRLVIRLVRREELTCQVREDGVR